MSTTPPAPAPLPIPDPVLYVFRGIGQIMFQEHALTGLLFVLGIAFGAPYQAIGIVAGAIIGTLTAHLLGYDRQLLAGGIYGFNSALVGIATVFFFQPGPGSIALLVVGSALAAVVTHLMRTHLAFPTYTTPFILVTWVIFFVGPSVGAQSWTGADADYGKDPFWIPFEVAATAHGVGQVMFQGTLVAGILFLIGLAVSDWRHAVLVLTGAIVGMLLATFHLDAAAKALDPERLIERSQFANIELGLYGYNATLTAVALFLWRKSWIGAVLGMLISVPLTELLPRLGLPALTAPFVLATWAVMLLAQLDVRFAQKPPESAA